MGAARFVQLSMRSVLLADVFVAFARRHVSRSLHHQKEVDKWLKKDAYFYETRKGMQMGPLERYKHMQVFSCAAPQIPQKQLDCVPMEFIQDP